MNFAEIKASLGHTRGSLSPNRFTEDDFEDYHDAVAQAGNESEILRNAFPILEGKSKAYKKGERSFEAMDPITDGSIVPPKPDVFVGAHPSTIDDRVRYQLERYIVPSNDPTDPLAPNFFVEVKGRQGTNDVALHQASLDGAVGTRAVLSVESFGSDAIIYNDQAHCISITFDGDLLRIFSHHAARPARLGSKPRCYMYQLASYAMTSDRESFVAGAAAFRNARNFAVKYLAICIKKANEKAQEMPEALPEVPSRNQSFASVSSSTSKHGSTSKRNSYGTTSFEETATQKTSATIYLTSPNTASHAKATKIRRSSRQKSEATVSSNRRQSC